MQFDYEMVPASNEFSPVALAEMAERLDGLVTRRLADHDFIVYRDATMRDVHPLPAPGEPDWVNGYVRLRPDRVVLGVVADDGVMRQLHEFARWVTARWPAHLDYFGATVPLDELLPA